MCKLYDNTWFEMLMWAKLGVIALAMVWTGYRGGAFASLSRWRSQTVAVLAQEDALVASDEPQPA